MRANSVGKPELRAQAHPLTRNAAMNRNWKGDPEIFILSLRDCPANYLDGFGSLPVDFEYSKIELPPVIRNRAFGTVDFHPNDRTAGLVGSDWNVKH